MAEVSPYDKSSRMLAEAGGKRMLCWLTRTAASAVG